MEAVSSSSTMLLKENTTSLVVFGLDEKRYALRLSAVDRIVRLLEITILPKAPDTILGVINIGGQIVPVYNLRARFQLPDREFLLNDHLIVARTSKRIVALVVDQVLDVAARPRKEITGTQDIFPKLEYIEGVVKLEDGLVFIHDLNTFLSIEEDSLLDKALSSTRELS